VTREGARDLKLNIYHVTNTFLGHFSLKTSKYPKSYPKNIFGTFSILLSDLVNDSQLHDICSTFKIVHPQSHPNIFLNIQKSYFL